jgi:CheY-like chemotaxis protein
MLNAPILYVENEPTDVMLVRRALTKTGVTRTLRDVENGEQAVNYLLGKPPFEDRQAHPLPAMILLDLSMPLMDGFEVLKWRLEQPELKLIPVVVFTSSRHQRDIVEAYRLGANGYLVKPTSTDELLKIVDSIRAFWLTHNELPPASS